MVCWFCVCETKSRHSSVSGAIKRCQRKDAASSPLENKENKAWGGGGHIKDKLLKDNDVITLNSLLTILPQDNHLISRCHCALG